MFASWSRSAACTARCGRQWWQGVLVVGMVGTIGLTGGGAGVHAAPAEAAETPPSLCSSEEEQDQDANEARCHAQRAASAAFRAREAADYAQRQKATLDKPVSMDAMQRNAAQAGKEAKDAADYAERKNAKDASNEAHNASLLAEENASVLSEAIGACQELHTICIGVHGEAYDAAENAGYWAHLVDLAVYAKNNTPADLVAADKAEADAVAAYRKAGWIVPEES